MQVWNIEVLATRQISEAIATELLPLFSTELSKSAESFQTASVSEDLLEAARICHQMRGSAALYGFKLLAQELLAAEKAIKTGQLLPSQMAGNLIAVATEIRKLV